MISFDTVQLVRAENGWILTYVAPDSDVAVPEPHVLVFPDIFQALAWTKKNSQPLQVKREE